MNIKWRDIYKNNKKRKLCEITGIKNEDVEIESNSFKLLKEKKFITIPFILIIFIILIFTFKNDIKVLLIVLAFMVFAIIFFFVFNYYKIKCLKEGLYIRFRSSRRSFSL